MILKLLKTALNPNQSIIGLYFDWYPNGNFIYLVLVGSLTAFSCQIFRIKFLAHLFNVSYCDHILSGVRPLCVVHRQHLGLLTLYRLQFASNLYESLSEHLSPSNLEQDRSLTI